MTNFKTRRMTAPNGYEYEIQVEEGDPPVELKTRNSPGAVGTEARNDRRTEDKAERRTEDKGGETTSGGQKKDQRRARPGAAARTPKGEG